jgi:hypothetical protein
MDELLELSLREVIDMAESKGTTLIHLLDDDGEHHSILLVHGESSAATLEELTNHFFGNKKQKN